MNQYWYSSRTIDTMVNEIQRVAKRVAFLSTPSVYFSLTDTDIKRNSRLFDIDEQFANDPGFVPFNFKELHRIPKEYHHYFDYVVIDPPFITDIVWEQYARAAKIVLMREDGVTSDSVPTLPTTSPPDDKKTTAAEAKAPAVASSPEEVNPFVTRSKLTSSPPRNARSIAANDTTTASTTPVAAPIVMPDGKGGERPLSKIPAPTTMPNGKMLLSTISEHEEILHSMLGASIRRYRPSIPTLIYQYVFFTNYDPTVTGLLDVLNPEIDRCATTTVTDGDTTATSGGASTTKEDDEPLGYRPSKYGGFGSDTQPQQT